jgi:hypothetical protein
VSHLFARFLPRKHFSLCNLQYSVTWVVIWLQSYCHTFFRYGERRNIYEEAASIFPLLCRLELRLVINSLIPAVIYLSILIDRLVYKNIISLLIDMCQHIRQLKSNYSNEL